MSPPHQINATRSKLNMNNTNHSKSIPQRARHHICRWCLLPLLLLLALPAAVQAQFLYTTYNGTITITGYTGPGADVTIPDTISGQAVTSIGDDAFYYCTSLTSVTVPDSVTSIGDSAFEYCGSLTKVTMGSGVTTIGSNAFRVCSSLSSVTIPNSVTNVEESAFGDCYSLTSVTVGTGVTSIGAFAFSLCLSACAGINSGLISGTGCNSIRAKRCA